MLSRYLLLIILTIFARCGFATQASLEHYWLAAHKNITNQIRYSNSVKDIYSAHGHQLLWFKPETVQEFEFLLELLELADLSNEFTHRLHHLKKLRTQGLWYEYDILATDSLIAYKIYSTVASIDGFDWFFGSGIELPQRAPSRQLIQEIISATKEHRLTEYLNSLSGTPQQMQHVLHAKLRLQNAIKRRVSHYKQRRTTRLGDPIADKETLLHRLDAVGLDVSHISALDTTYNYSLKTVIKQFQSMHGLKPDGILGPETVAWINVPFRDRLTSLALNTERARLLPKSRENIVIVNLPSFQLNYWHDGASVFTSKVIVGREERRTPLLRVEMDTLIVNPSWNVPSKLVKEDIIPQVKADINYLERMNIKVVKRWWSKEEIDPSTIDWNAVNPETFSYNMTQAPGKSNALGRYKFNTPNSRAIFLHDTPSKYLFNRTSRAYSSGCIRVQHADKFAESLLKIQGLEPPIQSIDKTFDSQSIALKKKIPVHILYQTAWIENGVVQYRKDIYGYDEHLARVTLRKN